MGTVQVRILTDTRISDSARVIGLWIATRDQGDEGWVPVSFDDLRSVLHGYPSDDTIRKHVRMLTGSGWLERRAGGRGNPDQFRIIDPLLTPPYSKDRPADSGGLKDRPATDPTLNGLRVGSEAGLSPPVVVEQKNVVVGEENARATAKTFPLSRLASEVMAERVDSFQGFRGSLTDYLEARVQRGLQYGYVQAIAGWIDGTDAGVFKLPDGSRLPSSEIPGMLATAFNELLAMDEAKMKRPVGETANLRTKLNILLRQRGGYAGHHGGSPEKAGAGATAGGINPISGDRSRRRTGG